jgi:hypothetical protein
MRRDFLVLMVGMLVLFGAPASALGAISAVNVTVTPSTLAAGAHPNVTVDEKFTYTGGDSVKDTTLHFPPGLLGNPQATPLCTQAAFQNGGACPANTTLGSTTVTATIAGLLQIPSSGTVYNLVPLGNEPALLGIVVKPLGGLGGTILLTSAISLRTATDFGIDSTVNNMPNSTSGLSTVINEVSLTLNGMAGTKAFMTNPTNCKVATTTLDADSYSVPATKVSGTSSFTPTSCDKLAFTPQLTASMGAPGATDITSHVPFTATITQPDNQSAQLSAAVTLPAGLGASTSGATALCSSAQLAAGTCPAGSRVGTGTISTPLLAAPVQGPVYEVAGGIGLPGVAVVFGGKLPFTLVGTVGAGVGNRLLNTFNGLPDVPLSTFTLAIDGGPHGLLAASTNLCAGAQRTVNGSFVGQSGAIATPSAPVPVIGCPISATASGRGFAGKRPRLSFTLSKAPAGPAFKSVAIKLPRNLKVVRARRGISVRAASALPKSAWKLSKKGVLALTLPKAGSVRISTRLSAGSIRASSSLLRILKRHRSTTLRLSVTVIDITGHKTVLPVRFTARR